MWPNKARDIFGLFGDTRKLAHAVDRAAWLHSLSRKKGGW